MSRSSSPSCAPPSTSFSISPPPRHNNPSPHDHGDLHCAVDRSPARFRDCRQRCDRCLLLASATVSNGVTDVPNLRQDERSLAATYTSATQYIPAMLTRINKERAAHGLPPLCWNHKLQAAAERHIKDQSNVDYMSGFGTDGSTPRQRVTVAGYKWQSVVESIDDIAANVDSVVDWWMKMKRGHILGNYTMVGTAYEYHNDSIYRKHHWVQVYATGSSETCDDA